MRPEILYVFLHTKEIVLCIVHMGKNVKNNLAKFNVEWSSLENCMLPLLCYIDEMKYQLSDAQWNRPRTRRNRKIQIRWKFFFLFSDFYSTSHSYGNGMLFLRKLDIFESQCLASKFDWDLDWSNAGGGEGREFSFSWTLLVGSRALTRGN